MPREKKTSIDVGRFARQVKQGDCQNESFLSRLQDTSKVLREEDLGKVGHGCWRAWSDNMGRIIRAADELFPMERGITFISRKYGHGVATFFVFIKYLFWLNVSVFFFWFVLVLLPWYLTYQEEQLELDTWETLKNFVGANGIVSEDRSWFYYSGYKSTMAEYPMGAMYTVAIFASIGWQIVLLVRKIGATIGRVSLAAHDPNLYLVRMVYGLDMRVSNASGVDLLLNNIRQHLLDAFSLHVQSDEGDPQLFPQDRADKRAKKGAVTSRKITPSLRIRRCLGISASIALLAGTNTVVFFLVENESSLSAYSPYLVTVSVSFTGLIGPFILKRIVAFEKWQNPILAVYHTVGRTYFAKMSNIAFLLYRIYTRDKAHSHKVLCVEAETGSLLLQLLIIDLLVTTLVNAGVSAVHSWWKARKGLARPTFNLSDSMLELVYAQTLVWLGTPVCPMLPLLASCAFVLRFFAKKAILTQWQRGPKGMAAGQDQYFFSLLFVLTLFLCLTPIGYFLQRDASPCGPHTNSTPVDSLDFVLDDATPASHLNFLLRPPVLLIVIGLLLIWVYLAHRKKARSDSLHRMKFEHKEQEARAFRRILELHVRSQLNQTLRRTSSAVVTSRGGVRGRSVSIHIVLDEPEGRGSSRSTVEDTRDNIVLGNPLRAFLPKDPSFRSPHTSQRSERSDHSSLTAGKEQRSDLVVESIEPRSCCADAVNPPEISAVERCGSPNIFLDVLQREFPPRT
ncbi:hypothetical protein DIPPA_59671 [Diplonema papillatum]|nr:hypothetical protein DIPPA_59671 [Diplonema papillatum]